MNQRFSLETLLARTGGNYILLVVAAAQILALPGALLGSISILLSADFALEQLRQLFSATPLLVLVGNLILLAVAWGLTRNARKRLTLVMTGAEYRVDATQERNAWKEITGLSWRYSTIGATVAFLVDIFLSSAYYYLRGMTTQAQFGYTLAGGLVSVIGMLTMTVLILDRLLIPARVALLPRDFEVQIKARDGVLLAGKFIVLILALTVVGVFMFVPIGFRNTLLALNPQGDPARIPSDIQTQSTVVSLLTLAFGLGLGYFVSRTISMPIKELIDTFRRVERGDLSQRASVTTTDEIAELTMHFNRMVARLEELQSSLEKQVYERTAQLKATNEVGSVASSILEPDELIKRTANLITDRFGHYYSAIYLLDQTGNWAELREATGEAGKVLKQNHHRIEVNSKNMIAAAINTRKAAVALDSGASAAHATNMLLPYTRSEIVLPLIVGDRVLGALDVQSTREAAFNPQDADTLQGMANQVAIALENARLYQEAQHNLMEMRAIQKQYLLEAWSNVADVERMDYSVGDEADEKSHSVEVPLALREQSLGLIKLLSDEEITPEEYSLMEAVASQAAIALENARLVNESRLVANRERLVSDISNKIWSSTTIDGVMQTAARELGRVLATTKVVIELKSDENNG